jgi:hypothetical protein
VADDIRSNPVGGGDGGRGGGVPGARGVAADNGEHVPNQGVGGDGGILENRAAAVAAATEELGRGRETS